MKFAIVGCQHVHLKMFIDEMLELGHEFAGILDKTDFYLPKQYSEDYKVPLLDSLDQLLSLGVNIIGNAERNDHKIDIIEWGEQHGIDVMTDKPIAVNEDGLTRLRKVIDRGKIKIGMMMTERFDPTLQVLKKLIDQGDLGDVLDFTFLKPHKVNRAKRPFWFFEKDINGGLIIDLFIHDVDTLKWLIGKKIVSYEAKLIKNILLKEYPTFYDNALMSILFEDHVTATLKADWLMPEAFDSWGDGRVFVTGTGGRVEIRSSGDVLGKPGHFITLTTHKQKAERLEVPKAPESLSEDFVNQINGKPYRLTAEDIYECNAAVVRMDKAALKLIRSN